MSVNRSGAYLVGELQNYINQGYFSLINEFTPPVTKNEIPSSIPKQIVVFWHDINLPDDVKASIEKIKKNNPGYRVDIFNAKTAFEFIQHYYSSKICFLYENRCIHPTMQADFFRICYLLKKGGIYVDIDIDCYASLDNICKHQDFGCFFLYARGQPSCIENGLIICKPNCFVLEAILNRLQKHLTTPQGFTNVWEYTGPGVVTMAIMEILLQKISIGVSLDSFKNYLKLGEVELTKRAYHCVDLDYKKTTEGNWRNFSVPNDLYKR